MAWAWSSPRPCGFVDVDEDPIAHWPYPEDDERVGRRLLEREPELSALAAAARDAGAGIGSVILLHGEAGIGKSSVVSALRAQQPAGGRMLVGSCDALSTPRVLGPLRDMRHAVGQRLAEALGAGDRDQVISALYDELAESPMTMLVIEDVHWADEATLDVIRFLGHRIDQLPVVLVLTYRDDGLDRDHPLHQVLGDLGNGEQIRRLPLRRLSRDAVGVLAAGSDLDPETVYGLTGGNPYFVTEVVASADQRRPPPTVVDAVLGRLRRLPRAVQDVVEQVAVIPSTVDHDLLELLVPGGLGLLRGAEEHGLLTVRPSGLRFRHELTRRAVADSLPASRRIELNRRALAALEAAGVADPSRLVHHAVEAADIAAVVRFAPEAAREAAASGAHREAAAHYGVALDHVDRYPLDQQADLWEHCAIERYTIGSVVEAVATQKRAVELRRALGVPTRLGASLRWLSRMQWIAGNRRGAEEAAQEATTVLEDAGDEGLLALALSNQSQLAMLAYDNTAAIALAERAIPLARQVGDKRVLSHALNNLGTSRLCLGDDGSPQLLEAVHVALEINDMEDASRAYVNLVWQLLERYRLDEADRHLTEAMHLAERAEFIGILSYMYMERARLSLARAHWDAALADANRRLLIPHARCVALTVTGTVYLRRGDPGADDVLAEARDLAARLDELQRTGPVAAARTESALLRGDVDEAVAIARPMYDEATRLGDQALSAELACRLRQAGEDVPVPPGSHPFAIQAGGRWREAAAAWAAAGCPYHEASALAESSEPGPRLEALAILDRIGAEPLGRQIRAQLRVQGVRGVPRGPAARTRQNPAGLTERQVDVLRFLADGLTNAEIAERLVVSVRTVDSHVAAILAKLDVPSRTHVRDRALELDLLGANASTSR